MNVNELVKRITKGINSGLKLKKEELLEVLDYYKKLQVVYIDPEENVVFLWLKTICTQIYKHFIPVIN